MVEDVGPIAVENRSLLSRNRDSSRDYRRIRKRQHQRPVFVNIAALRVVLKRCRAAIYSGLTRL